jgi:hypothetical protein
MHNFTRQAPLSEQQLAERQAWYDEQMTEAANVNAAAMLAKQQQDTAEFQNRLVEATGLPETTLQAIKAWLQHNA